VPRTATTLLVVAVLVASAAAFAVSEGLKVQRASVTGTHVAKTFSPICRCPTDRAAIEFRLTRADRLSISIVDEDGKPVRTLVHGRLFGRGLHHFTWNGRDDGGRLVRQASYRPRIHLQKAGRTLTLPNPIRLDVTPPHIAVVSVKPAVLSPDGDNRSDVLHVHYRVSEHAHALLYVNGTQRVRTLFQRLRDQINWYGKVNGRALPPGKYRLTLVAVDRAGNRSRPVSAGVVRIRYVQLPTGLLIARPRARLRVTVSTDARSVHFVLRRGSSMVGSGSGSPRLEVPLPAKPGRYVLVVSAAGHQAQAIVLVRKR
jgi:hypothetical protein